MAKTFTEKEVAKLMTEAFTAGLDAALKAFSTTAVDIRISAKDIIERHQQRCGTGVDANTGEVIDL